jgi:hypothetical protein
MIEYGVRACIGIDPPRSDAGVAGYITVIALLMREEPSPDLKKNKKK